MDSFYQDSRDRMNKNLEIQSKITDALCGNINKQKIESAYEEICSIVNQIDVPSSIETKLLQERIKNILYKYF